MSLKTLQAKFVKAGVSTGTVDGKLVVGLPTGYHGESASHAHKRLDDIHNKHGHGTARAKQFINNRTNKTTHPHKLSQWHHALKDQGYHHEAGRVKDRAKELGHSI